jgi:hypothetical protein
MDTASDSSDTHSSAEQTTTTEDDTPREELGDAVDQPQDTMAASPADASPADADPANADRPNVVTAVTVDHVLQWGNYVLACPICGATKGWTLQVQADPIAVGEHAWRVCSNGHRSTHPLIYPEIVHDLIAWTHSPRNVRPPLADLLQDWQPHRILWLMRAQTPTLEWVSWSTHAPQDYWSTRWPELVDAATADPEPSRPVARQPRTIRRFLNHRWNRRALRPAHEPGSRHVEGLAGIQHRHPRRHRRV